jgi:MarR family transcriptional regulator, temperature-dependent positive regulator of motility
MPDRIVRKPDLDVNRPVSAPKNIGRLLVDAARAFEVELNERLRQRGYADVRLSHSAVFGYIDRAGTRVVELADRAGMTKQSMGELVDDLVAKGYLERQPDPLDRRAKLIVLTSQGRRHIRAAQAEITAIEARYGAQLGRQRLESLRTALALLAGATR